MKERRQQENKKAEWEQQQIVADVLAQMQRDQLKTKLKFYLLFIPGLLLFVALMIYVAMILPGLFMGI